MLNVMNSLSEMVFKVSHGDSNKYITYFIRAQLMETGTRMFEKEKVIWQENVWLQKKGRSRMIAEVGYRVERWIIFW